MNFGLENFLLKSLRKFAVSGNIAYICQVIERWKSGILSSIGLGKQAILELIGGNAL